MLHVAASVAAASSAAAGLLMDGCLLVCLPFNLEEARPTWHSRLRSCTFLCPNHHRIPMQVCLPINLEDDGYNMVHTHDNYAAFILAGKPCALHVGQALQA